MTLEKLNKSLRIIVIIGLIIIVIISLYFKYGDCDKCKFKINGINYDAMEFMKKYSEKCFNVTKTKNLLELPKINISIN